jgi:hypothetical protein
MLLSNNLHAPQHRLEWYSISTLESAGINYPEGPKNIKKQVRGNSFSAATRHLTPTVVKYKRALENE